MGTTISGIRVPTTGDVFDVPGDMTKNTTDIVAALAAAAVINGKLTRGLQVQAFTAVPTTNSTGDLTLPLPPPFASAPQIVLAAMGDITFPLFIAHYPTFTTASVVAFRIWNAAGAPLVSTGPIRINVIAVGTAV